jgi:hypothetical protein
VLRHPQPALLDAVARSAAQRLPEFSNQDLVLTLWAYGAVRHCPAEPALFYAACSTLLARRRRLLPMQVVMALQAFAKAGFQPPPAFMSELAGHVVERLQGFRPAELCHVLWAYARMGYCDAGLVEAVVAHLARLLGSGDGAALPKEIVDSAVWAAQRVGFWPGGLIEAAEARGVYTRRVVEAAEAEGRGSDSVERSSDGALRTNGYIPRLAAAGSSPACSGGSGGRRCGGVRAAGEVPASPAAALPHSPSALAWEQLQPTPGLRPRPPLPPQLPDGQQPTPPPLLRPLRARRPPTAQLSLHGLQQRLQAQQRRRQPQQQGQQQQRRQRQQQQLQEQPQQPRQLQQEQQQEHQRAPAAAQRQQRWRSPAAEPEPDEAQGRGDGWGASGGPSWLPDARTLQLLESADYGDDTPQPQPPAPNLQPLGASRR